ncbi:molecular chaperone DnaK [Peribacillus cavernae]|uniref:Molecular chaperone DnaK n=1 Tax=Peribacillus cavernae TaxID=1674310 RepID=A0A3S0UHT8_9BACI|nr:TraR/DksA C4-type zinc finger protein [Peribacillus cavernae]MDQ0220253.1 YteA family regulatory protein [Peribacillus cavernae]RUQ31918.1 molecular chaperone DnaK [Peribacillus cavernae]
MATKEQITILKKELLNNKEQLQHRIKQDEDTLMDTSQSDSVGELSAYDNHPADMGTELFEREKNMAIDDHAEAEIKKIDSALEAIENGSYGTCRTCGKEIRFERLEAVPTSLYCVDHAPEQRPGKDRPVEEEVLEPSHGDHFENRRKGNEINDKEDSFGEVARFGTSETPSDYTGDHESYDTLYKNEDENDGFTEEYESFLGNDIDGKNKKAYPSKQEKEYEEALDNEHIESPLGNVPYKRTDGYVNDEKREKGK